VNPYASHLGNRNAREVIAETPRKLTDLVAQLGPPGLERSLAPGKWPARLILCHLADCETVFAFRLRQALAEPYHVIQPFDQDVWAVRYSNADARTALAVFSATRQWNLALLDTVTPEELSKTLNHPERGDMTFQTVIETIGGHDLNHLQQLETIASQAAA
jgi:hypothetical protein